MRLTDRILWDIPLSDNEKRAFVAAIILGALLLLALPSVGRWGMALIGGWR